MNLQDAMKLAAVAVIDGILKTALTSPNPNPVVRGRLEPDEFLIKFPLIEDKALPLALQRKILLELPGINLFDVADDPQWMHFDIISTFEFVVDVNKLNDYKNNLLKELSASTPVNTDSLLPALAQENKLIQQLSAPPSLATNNAADSGDDTFGPLKTDNEANIWCNGKEVDLPDRFRFLLGFLIRYPGYHKISDIARELYPTSTLNDAKTVHDRISKYVSAINTVLDDKTDEKIRIVRNKFDLDIAGYKLVEVKKRKPRVIKDKTKTKRSK